MQPVADAWSVMRFEKGAIRTAFFNSRVSRALPLMIRVGACRSVSLRQPSYRTVVALEGV